MEICKGNTLKKGVGAGLFSGFTWAVDVIIVSIILSSTAFIKDERLVPLLPFVCAFFKDFFSFIWITIFTKIKGELPGIFKKTCSKNGLYIVLGALIGGPIGLCCYMLSIKYIGPAYTANISSIYPVISALCAGVFLKEALGYKNKIGIVLSTLGVILISYSSGGAIGGSWKRGIILAFATAVCWGLESVICSLGMRNDEINSYEAFNIRQMVSSLCYLIFIIPFTGAWPLVMQIFKSPSIYLLIVTSLISSLSYIMWYTSISLIGAAKGTSLNVTYVVWSIILQWIFLKTCLSFRFIIGSIVVMVGVVYVVSVSDKIEKNV